MEENLQKEDIKLLAKKRKIDHDNLEKKDLENNKDDIPEKNSDIQNSINLKQQEPEKQEKKELIENEIKEDICPKCGIKNILYFFKNENDINNYFLSKKIDIKEDIKNILQEKFKDKEIKINKKICENCINDLLSKEEINFIKYIFDENEINPNNNNIIKEVEKNKNIESKEEAQQIIDNKLRDTTNDIRN